MASERNKGAMYFACVAAAGRNRAVVTGHYYIHENTDEQITPARLIENGNWISLKAYTGIIHAVRHDPDAKLEFLLLERMMTLYRVSAAAEYEFETISTEREAALMDLRKIGTHWYVVGGQHQVLRREQKKWRPIDDGIFIAEEDGFGALLQSIDGTSESNIYTVGTNGVIFHFDGREWSEMDPPTDYDLERVLCVGEEVYLCGMGNTLYRGAPDAWLPLTEKDDAVRLWDMAYFRGKVYVCSDDKLFVIEDDKPKAVEIPVEGPLSFYRLAAGETDLWGVDKECVLQFDGTTWTQHVYPENR